MGDGSITNRPIGVSLVKTFPALAEEIVGLLHDEPELAAQVPDLIIESWCDCGDDFCQTFQTVAEWPSAYDGYTMPNDTEQGMLNLDVVKGRIIGVETLWYPPLM